jgi:hypothetical protein
MASKSHPVRKKKKTPDKGWEPDAQSGSAETNVPPAPSIPDLPPTKTHCEITCKTEKTWWDKIKPLVEIVGIGLLAIYTFYTIKMYRATKESADAAQVSADTAKRALEITERAYVNLGSPISYAHGITGHTYPTETVLMVPLENSGHIPATLKACNVHMIRFLQGKAFHSANVVLCEESMSLPPGSGHFTMAIPLLDFLQNEMREIKSGREQIEIEGAIRYDDGFGVTDNFHFCLFSNKTIPTGWGLCPTPKENQK